MQQTLDRNQQIAAEAVRSLRNLFLSSLLVFVVWFVSWEPVVDKLRGYRDTLDLHAWIYLKERMAELDVSYVLKGIGLETSIDLKIGTTWPTVNQYRVTLRPEHYFPENTTVGVEKGSQVRIYCVNAEETLLPFEDYMVVFVDDESVGIVPRNDPDINNNLDNYGLLRRYSKARNLPKRWDLSKLWLRGEGFRGDQTELSSGTQELKDLRKTVDPQDTKIGILGVQLDIRLFSCSVGVFLGAIAFVMIAPILALRRSGCPTVSQPWIFATPTRGGNWVRWLELPIWVVSVVWILCPMFVLLRQWPAKTLFTGELGWFFLFGSWCLGFSCVVHASACAHLHTCRRRFRPSP